MFAKRTLRCLSQAVLAWTILHLFFGVAAHWRAPLSLRIALCSRPTNIVSATASRPLSRSLSVQISITAKSHSSNSNSDCPLCAGLADTLPPIFNAAVSVLHPAPRGRFVRLSSPLLEPSFVSLPPPARAPPRL